MTDQIDLMAREINFLRDALVQAEACMSIVEPRSDKAEYLRILGVVRAALGSAAPIDHVAVERFARVQLAGYERKHGDSDCNWCDLARAYLSLRVPA